MKHTLTARLQIDPVVTGLALGWRLTWRLAVAEGIEGAGPAGAAELQLGEGEATISSDYSDPRKLLQVDVPFGLVQDEPGMDGATAQAGGSIADADAEIVEALFGESVRCALTERSERLFTTSVPENDAWMVVGRAAILSQLLADRHQPVAGLWGVELADVLSDLGNLTAARRRSEQLLDEAENAMAHMPARLADTVRRQFPRVAQMLLHAATRSQRTLGPLTTELRSQDADVVLGDLGSFVEQAAEALANDGESEELADIPVFLGGAPVAHADDQQVELGIAFRGYRGEPTIALHEDFSAGGLLRSVAARLDGNELTVDASADSQLGALRRLHVRVTSDGDLVAAALSFASVDRKLRSRLALPPRSGPVDVVVGRNLPFEPLDETAFQERQAIHYARRVVDGARGPQIDSAGVVDDEAKRRAVESWENAGRSDLAALVDTMAPREPFVTELGAPLAEELRLRDLADGTDEISDARLAGARELAWSLGDLGGAGAFELRRRRDPAAEPLSTEQHDTLVLSMAALGAFSDAIALDELAPGIG